MRLIVDGGTNADDSELVLADYASIDALITAIGALGKGWSCTVLATDTASRDASDLLIRPSMVVDNVARAYIEAIDDEITEYKVIYSGEDRNYGLIEKPGEFSPTTEYFVDFVAGYTTIPGALEMACLELVKHKYNRSQKSSGLKSEKMGKVYAYENFGISDLMECLGIHPEIKAGLDLFRRREF